MKKPVGHIKDNDTRDVLEFLMAEFSENIIELSAAPAAAAPLLNDNQRGLYNNNLYIRKGSTIYVFASASQITIT